MLPPERRVAGPVAALLEEERAALRPFEALAQLTDAQLDVPVPAAHGWSGRDVIAHVIAWLDDALTVATELRTQASSPARERSREAFAASGDDINARIQAEWRALPIDEVRRRLRDVPVALRAAVAAAPDVRWTDDPENLRFIHVYTVEHYEEHVGDLEAILEAASQS
jgi:hypothetical protein